MKVYHSFFQGVRRSFILLWRGRASLHILQGLVKSLFILLGLAKWSIIHSGRWTAPFILPWLVPTSQDIILPGLKRASGIIHYSLLHGQGWASFIISYKARVGIVQYSRQGENEASFIILDRTRTGIIYYSRQDEDGHNLLFQTGRGQASFIIHYRARTGTIHY